MSDEELERLADLIVAKLRERRPRKSRKLPEATAQDRELARRLLRRAKVER